MFSSASFSSISFATVTPSLVMVGEPNFLSRTTLRPFGPRVTFTASASWLTPRRIACRDCSPYTICFAMFSSLLQCGPSGPPFQGGANAPRLLVDDRENFVLAHDQVLFAVDLDFL